MTNLPSPNFQSWNKQMLNFKHLKVTVYYSGRLKSNNKQFDSAQSGPGFKFRLGKGEVIRGWDLGVEGMKVGGKRRLTIPAQLAYV